MSRGWALGWRAKHLSSPVITTLSFTFTSLKALRRGHGAGAGGDKPHGSVAGGLGQAGSHLCSLHPSPLLRVLVLLWTVRAGAAIFLSFPVFLCFFQILFISREGKGEKHRC